jgi:hypothetical protein
MVAGGGHRTDQWFGMYYANQPGKRLPVPIFQAMEDFAIFGILLLVERWLRSSAPTAVEEGSGPAGTLLPPAGIVLGVGMVLWGIERFLDEHLWLGEDGHLGSLLVQWAGIALAVVGIVLLVTRLGSLQRWRRGEGGDPAPVPPVPVTPSRTTGTGSDQDSGTGPEDGGAGDPEGTGGPTMPAPVPSTVPSVTATKDD